MTKVVVFGAGRSSGYVIRYLLDYAQAHDFKITVIDAELKNALDKIAGHPAGVAVAIDIENEADRKKYIQEAEVVVSMMPPHLHTIIAEDCLLFGSHLVTASYVSPSIKLMDEAARKAGLCFMNEIGLDPGIDHMSAMKIIHDVQEKGAKIHSFKSWCGGLVAPESDDNPWHYKISWNPKNVLNAGNATAKYLYQGTKKFIPYHSIFKTIYPIEIGGKGIFDGYANRDSLSYIDDYNLLEVDTLLRGTLRHQGYCKAWDILIAMGLTDDTFEIEDTASMSYADFTKSFLPESYDQNISCKENFKKIYHLESDPDILEKMEYLGLFSTDKIPFEKSSPANILMDCMLKKWQLKPDDKDLVIMKHEFEYTIENKKYFHESILYLEGLNAYDTAMAKTVGLPAAIFTTMILEGKCSLTGVQIPIHKEVYEFILPKLEMENIIFKENIQSL